MLSAMGLGALLSEDGEGAQRPRARPVKHRRPPSPAHLEHLRRLARDYPLRRLAPGTRKMDHLLRLMEPGKCYVMADLRRACRQLSRGSVHGFIGVKFIRYGYLERVAAPPGLTHRGPLDHGSPQLFPIRWVYRLTAKGIAEAETVAEADRRSAAQ